MAEADEMFTMDQEYLCVLPFVFRASDRRLGIDNPLFVHSTALLPVIKCHVLPERYHGPQNRPFSSSEALSTHSIRSCICN